MFPQTVSFTFVIFKKIQKNLILSFIKNMGHTAELIFRFRRLKFHLASLRYGEFSLQTFLFCTTTAA